MNWHVTVAHETHTTLVGSVDAVVTTSLSTDAGAAENVSSTKAAGTEEDSRVSAIHKKQVSKHTAVSRKGKIFGNNLISFVINCFDGYCISM